MKGFGKAAVPVGVVSIVLMLVVPLPAALMDLLIGLNLAISLLILLVAMQIKKPLDFAVFPSLLLIATLFRLALNVSSTRLVLTDWDLRARPPRAEALRLDRAGTFQRVPLEPLH